MISLLSDLIKHSHLITRENIFLSEGREYDIEKAKEAFFKKTADNSGDFEAHIIQPDEDYMGSKKRHEEFDFLGGVKPQDRKPDDSIKKGLLENLKKRIIETSQKIKIYSNKFLAHPATPESRQIVEIDPLLWNDIFNAQKLFTQIVCFLSSHLFKTSITSFIPVVPSNKLEFLERPLVLEKDLVKVNEMWGQIEIESKKWKDWNNSEFLKGL